MTVHFTEKGREPKSRKIPEGSRDALVRGKGARASVNLQPPGLNIV